MSFCFCLLSQVCSSSDDAVATRALILLGLFLPSNAALTDQVVDQEFLSDLLNYLKFGLPNQVCIVFRFDKEI